MAGQAKSEEGDAFDDVTPARPVSVDDLDYDGGGDVATRAQSSEEIAEFQKQAREKREAAFRSFRPPTERTSSPSSVSSPDLMGAPPSGTDSGARRLPPEGGSGSMPRPVPRESGPQLIGTRREPEKKAEPEKSIADADLEQAVADVAATLEKLPAPRAPKVETPATLPERIVSAPSTPPAAEAAPARSQAGIALFALIAIAIFVGLTFFR